MVIAIPAVTSLVAFALLNETPIARFIPRTSDEIAYWHSTLTWIEAGFDGGYYVYNEVPASTGAFYHFGAWGPAYMVLYGSLGAVLGWSYLTPLVINALLVSLALGLALWLAQPDVRQLGLLTLVLLTFWPMQLYLLAVMQESVHYALAIVLAAGFHVLSDRRDERSVPLLAALIGLIVAGILFRFTWAVVLLPVLLVASRGRNTRAALTALAVTGAAGLAGFVYSNAFSAPYPFGLRAVLAAGDASILARLRQLAGLVYYNLTWFFRGEFVAIVARLTVLLIVAWVASALWQQWRAHRQSAGHTAALLKADPDLWFHLLNLGTIFALQFAYSIYESRDYRIVAPHLLASLLLLVFRQRYRLALACVVLSAVGGIAFQGFYDRDRNPIPAIAPEVVSDFGAAVDGLLAFDRQADPWCNTVLVTDFHAELPGLPGGMGFTVLLGIDPDDLARPAKSQYLLMDADALAQYGLTEDSTLLTVTTAGNLYRNNASDCPDNP